MFFWKRKKEQNNEVFVDNSGAWTCPQCNYKNKNGRVCKSCGYEIKPKYAKEYSTKALNVMSKSAAQNRAVNTEPPIPESEKKYYQPDSYYVQKTHEGTQFERGVITFEERKKISTVSRNGLYVAEILLLQYVSYGTYPHPKNGYPAFWWFEYGIRNVGAKLQSLEERGFIRMSTPHESISSLTVPQLKEILKAYNLPLSGKKDDLVQRIKENLSDNDINGFIPEYKYTLTNLGTNELSENEYVTIMHKSPDKTDENSIWGPVFNVWEVNRRLSQNPDWRSIIEDMKQEQVKYQYEKEEKEEKRAKELEDNGIVVDKSSGKIIGFKKPNGKIVYIGEADASDITVSVNYPENNRTNILDSPEKMEQYSVANSLRICRESIKIIYETTNPDTFFSRYEIILREVTNIENYSDKFNFGDLSPQTMRQEVIDDKQKYICNMIERYWSKTFSEAENLKTNNGKKNCYQKFYDTLEQYKNEMNDDNIRYYTDKYQSAVSCLK